MLKKRCEVCGKVFFTKNRTCGRRCGQVVQRKTCQDWWDRNKVNFSKKLREIRAKKLSPK